MDVLAPTPIYDGKLFYQGASMDDLIQPPTGLTPAGPWYQLATRSRVQIRPRTFRHSSMVLAYIDTGRWIASCPDCNSANFVWKDDPWFMCLECWNFHVGGRWRAVQFPAAAQELERALLVRPDRANRFSYAVAPGDQTPKHLHAENKEHGLPPRYKGKL